MYVYIMDMSGDCRRYLRGAARKVDESHPFRNFREDYAKANNAIAAQKQAATVRKKKNADKRLEELQEFEPDLNLEGWVIDDARVDRMTTQLRWHRHIGGDGEIPPLSHLNKEKLWDAMKQAVKRHQEKNTDNEGEWATCLSLPQL